MAKFCTKCGKKLEEGQVCSCEAKATKATSSNNGGFDVKECANSYLDMLKGIFTKPVETIKLD